MNRLIKELVIKAYNDIGQGTPEELSLFMQVYSEKFAELIVEKCVNLIETNNPRPPGTVIMYNLDQDEYFDTGWQVATETKAHQIKQYFGIKS